MNQQTELGAGAGGAWGSDDCEEAVLLGPLANNSVHICEIGCSAGLAITPVNSMLTLLELKGMVRQVGCMHYAKSRVVGAVYGN